MVFQTILKASECDGDIDVVKCIGLVNILSVKTACVHVLQCLTTDSPTSSQGLSRSDVSAAVSIHEKKINAVIILRKETLCYSNTLVMTFLLITEV